MGRPGVRDGRSLSHLAEVPSWSRALKTILFVHASDELYGSDRCLLEIVRHLPEDYRALVVLPTDISHPGKLTTALKLAGATVLHRRMLVFRRPRLKPRYIPDMALSFLVGIWTLTRIIRRENVMLVHSNTVAVACGPFAAAIARRPHLWHVHEFLSDEPVLIRAVLRMMLRMLPGDVVANSRATARATRVKRATVIENAVFVDVTSPRAERESGPVTIGFVGRLSARKGISEALHAAALLHSRGTTFELLIVGSAPPEQQGVRYQYQRLATELGISDFTHFLGERDDMRTIYARIDILLVPSQRPEPFGLSIVEGMAAGCAVVATRNGGGSDEIITDGTDGIYCSPDARSIADALQPVIENPELRKTLAVHARETALTRFDSRRYVAEVLKTYSRIGA